MRRRILLLLFALCTSLQWTMAQNPKWVEKAKHAVFSIVTYDKNDKILNTGNGFFVSEDGIALSDYALFKGAQRAVIINYEGKQMLVESIMGADDMYDVVKFRVGITEKKVPALSLSVVPPVVGADIYLLPYSTRSDRSCAIGKVKAADKIEGGYSYYTLDMRLADKMVSCPLATTDGQVFGMAQKSSGQDTATICYAIDVNFAMKQSISALSFSDMALNDIGIKKALPGTEEEALVFLYMASGGLSSDEYMLLLDDFIACYPNNPDGYLRRATQQLFLSKDEASMDKVAEDLDEALSVASQKDDVYFNRAKTIYSYMLDDPDPVYKDWSYDKALEEIRSAIAIKELPVYVQTEGDILFAKQDYAAAFASYDKVNKSDIASPATFFSAARAKELMQAPMDEVLAIMDSCVARCPQPYTESAAPYIFERARIRMEAGHARDAMFDYNAYFNAVNGNVNDLFYYYREQAAVAARQYQIALDDLAKAIELNPQELLYYAELAVVNIRVGRNEEAIDVLNKALEINPEYSEAYRLMGLAQVQMKRNEDACASFAKAKELGDPNVDELIKKHCK